MSEEDTPTGCDVLFIGGYSKRRRRVTVGGMEFEIKQGKTGGELSGLVWPSSIIAAELIVKKYSNGCGKRALELGAGCGLGSLVAASQGWAVTATDTEIGLTDVLRNVNISSNASLSEATGGSIAVTTLDWSAFDSSNLAISEFDLIIVSDCLNIPKLHDALVEILSNISDNATILITSQLRRLHSERSFFLKLSNAGFRVSEVELPETAPFCDQQLAFLYAVEVVKGPGDSGIEVPRAAILRKDINLVETPEPESEDEYPDGLYL